MAPTGGRGSRNSGCKDCNKNSDSESSQNNLLIIKVISIDNIQFVTSLIINGEDHGVKNNIAVKAQNHKLS